MKIFYNILTVTKHCLRAKSYKKELFYTEYFVFMYK